MMRLLMILVSLLGVAPLKSLADERVNHLPIVGVVRADKKIAILAFKFDGTSWSHLTKPLLSSFPTQWSEIFDGKTDGSIKLGNKQNLIPGRDRLKEYRKLQVRVEVEVHSVPQSASKVQGQKDDVLGLRPIAITTFLEARDPDNWKPAKSIPDTILSLARAKFFKENCPSEASMKPAKMEEYLPLSKAERNLNFVSDKKLFLIQLTPTRALSALKPNEECRLGYSDYGSRLAYFVQSDGTVISIGGDVNMIEAADFDGDKSSELLLSGNFGPEVHQDPWPGPSPSLSGMALLSMKKFKGPVVWSWKAP